jgi:hypothetical protein
MNYQRVQLSRVAAELKTGRPGIGRGNLGYGVQDIAGVLSVAARRRPRIWTGDNGPFVTVPMFSEGSRVIQLAIVLKANRPGVSQGERACRVKDIAVNIGARARYDTEAGALGICEARRHNQRKSGPDQARPTRSNSVQNDRHNLLTFRFR